MIAIFWNFSKTRDRDAVISITLHYATSCQISCQQDCFHCSFAICSLSESQKNHTVRSFLRNIGLFASKTFPSDVLCIHNSQLCFFSGNGNTTILICCMPSYSTYMHLWLGFHYVMARLSRVTVGCLQSVIHVPYQTHCDGCAVQDDVIPLAWCC